MSCSESSAAVSCVQSTSMGMSRVRVWLCPAPNHRLHPNVTCVPLVGMSRLCPLLYRSSPASHNEEAVSCSTSAMLKGDCAILLLCCNYISAGHTAPEENGGVCLNSPLVSISLNTCHAILVMQCGCAMLASCGVRIASKVRTRIVRGFDCLREIIKPG